MTSETPAEKTMSSIIYPTTNLKATEQLCIERGDGVYIYDSKGKQYLEGIAGLWCTALGYGNEELIEAATEQMRTLSFSHMFGGKTHQVGIDLADKIASIVPVENARVFFGNSGSDANDTLVKMINYSAETSGNAKRRKIIARDRAYHGVTVASASLTGLAATQAHFQLPIDALGILRTDAPHFYHQGLAGETEDQFADRLAENLEQLIINNDPETIAAMIAEPINGAGGVIVPPENYFAKIQTVLDKYGITMWADEVITGFGRTGCDFGSTTVGMKPKMMTLAKALSSAYMPISAAIISEEMYQTLVEPSAKIGAFGHGYTYSGHPVAAAVALKTIEIYERDNIYQRAAKTGEYLLTKLHALGDHPLVGEVRGKGLLAAIELMANKETKQSFNDGTVGSYANLRCQENGLICRAVAGNTLAFCPPLIITMEQIDELIEKLTLSLNETLAYAQKERLMT
ncbi:MAG: 4-aminobutyrate--pyruvate transaminase [Pseudomonadales bacterium]|jgi:4-aminobutyrate--pyruvate transaminase